MHPHTPGAPEVRGPPCLPQAPPVPAAAVTYAAGQLKRRKREASGASAASGQGTVAGGDDDEPGTEPLAAALHASSHVMGASRAVSPRRRRTPGSLLQQTGRAEWLELGLGIGVGPTEERAAADEGSKGPALMERSGWKVEDGAVTVGGGEAAKGGDTKERECGAARERTDEGAPCLLPLFLGGGGVGGSKVAPLRACQQGQGDWGAGSAAGFPGGVSINRWLTERVSREASPSHGGFLSRMLEDVAAVVSKVADQGLPRGHLSGVEERTSAASPCYRVFTHLEKHLTVHLGSIKGRGCRARITASVFSDLVTLLLGRSGATSLNTPAVHHSALLDLVGRLRSANKGSVSECVVDLRRLLRTLGEDELARSQRAQGAAPKGKRPPLRAFAAGVPGGSLRANVGEGTELAFGRKFFQPW